MSNIHQNSTKVKPSLEDLGRECAKLALQVAALHHQESPLSVQREIEKAVAQLVAAKSMLFRAQWIADASPSMVEVG